MFTSRFTSSQCLTIILIKFHAAQGGLSVTRSDSKRKFIKMHVWAKDSSKIKKKENNADSVNTATDTLED